MCIRRTPEIGGKYWQKAPIACIRGKRTKKPSDIIPFTQICTGGQNPLYGFARLDKIPFREFYLQCAIFTFTRITLLLLLVIISPLHNNKQDVESIGFGIIFSRFEGIFKLEKNPIACISHTPTLRQHLEEKSATYTQVYMVVDYHY